MPDRLVALHLLLCYWLATIVPPPGAHAFTAVYRNNEQPQERKFGGYRIVPRTCKDTGSKGGSGGKGVCMFNYECAQREGTVVGSCMDGFLFGACCRLPTGSIYTSLDLPSTQTTSSHNTLATHTSSASHTPRPFTYKPAADTILIHQNGSVVQDENSPEDFTPKPESTSVYGGENTATTTGVIADGGGLQDEKVFTTSRYSPKPIKVTSGTFYYDRQKTTVPGTYAGDDNMIKVPTLTVNDIGDQDVEDATNTASINHILNILNESSPLKTTSQPSLSTWLSINSKAPEKSSTPSYYASTHTIAPYTNTKYHQYSTPPYLTATYATSSPALFYKPQQSENYSTQYKPPSWTTPSTTHQKPSTWSSSTSPGYYVYDTKSTTTQTIVGPSFQVTPQVDITPKPQSSGITTQEPAPTVIVLGPLNPVSTKKPIKKPIAVTIESTTATTAPELPQKQATIVTIKPQQTVITIKPNRPQKPDPHKPQYTQIVLPKPGENQPDVIITTSSGLYKPPSHINTTHTGTKRPPVSEAGTYITAKPQLAVSQKPPHVLHLNSPQSDYTPSYDNGSTELMIAFPPVRDPNVNLTVRPTITQQDTDTTLPDQDTSTPHFTVDENLDNKVHGFVEKIVQSLEGNFVDLENVLLDGHSRPNITVNQVPVKRPSTVRPLTLQNTTGTKRPTKKPPTQRPTKISTTVLITRPPSSTSTTTTTTRKPPPSPSSSTVVLFQPIPSTTTVTTPTNKPTTTKKPKITKRPSTTVSTTIIIESDISPTEDSSLDTTTEEIRPTSEIDYRKECGVRPLMKNGRIVGGKGATFGEWPWQVLVREATWLGLFTKNKCGGVLITNRYVITAAHCQPGFLASLVAVFGEYDISGELESKRSVSKNVKRVIVHRQYDAATFENDIALLELESPVQFDTHIVPICMPQDDEDFTGKMATVTGWGRLKYGGGVPSVLQEVHVPVMENSVCQEMFQTAGHTKSILTSFLCAGYANGQRDSCEGDSGGPLMVERENGHWVLAGTVSHGIKCAAPYLPGVYMRTTYYKPWLQTITGVRNL